MQPRSRAYVFRYAEQTATVIYSNNRSVTQDFKHCIGGIGPETLALDRYDFVLFDRIGETLIHWKYHVIKQWATVDAQLLPTLLTHFYYPDPTDTGPLQ